MSDVNSVLRKKLYELLSPVVGVPVYYKYIPAGNDTAAYVLISTITGIDASTMITFDTDVTIQLGIYTRDSQANSGAKADAIAQIIYNTLLPVQPSVIDLSPNFQNYALKRVNDVSPDAILTNNFAFINRFITLRAGIFHRA